MLFISVAFAQNENFAGHYYLSDVTEVGSELLLKQDGSFEWAMSYGAVDQQSQGTWKIQEGQVVLTSKALKPLRPFLSLKGIEPWSDDATRQLKYIKESANDEKAYAFCPFLEGQIAYAGGKPKQQAQPADAAAASVTMNDYLDSAATNKAGKLAIARLPAVSSAFHALRIQTKAEINAFQVQLQDSESWAKASNALMARLKSYQSAEGALRKMIVQAMEIDYKYHDLFDNDDLHPIWQYAKFSCSKSVEAKFKEPNVAYVAIYVDDPEHSLHIASNTKAQIKFADGSVQNITGFDSGYAMATLQTGQSITGINIYAKKSKNDSITNFDFTVKVDRQSIIHVLMDVTELIPIPFETLALPIKANGLIYQDGIYKKQ